MSVGWLLRVPSGAHDHLSFLDGAGREVSSEEDRPHGEIPVEEEEVRAVAGGEAPGLPPCPLRITQAAVVAGQQPKAI